MICGWEVFFCVWMNYVLDFVEVEFEGEFRIVFVLLCLVWFDELVLVLWFGMIDWFWVFELVV